MSQINQNWSQQQVKPPQWLVLLHLSYCVIFLIGVRRLDNNDVESFRISKGKKSKQNNIKSIKVPPSTA